jgi:signal transduction histidine kinase
MGGHEQVNILLVDDHPAKLLCYEAILSELGENLIKATSGSEALGELLQNDIAVVLMDVRMPDLDGFELAEIIRQHPRFQQTAVVFVSAVHLSEIDQIKGYQRGAVDYISVPVNPELLRAKISVFIELQRKRRQSESLNRELRRLSNQLVLSQDEERGRIARELHDGLGQELFAAGLIFARIREEDPCPLTKDLAAQGNSMIASAIQEIRSISHLLHPPMLDEAGLACSVQWYLDGLTKRTGIATTLDLQPPDFPGLPQDLEIALFRIVQEALTNVFRHSGACQAWVTMIQRDCSVIVSVRDNGKGVEEQVAELHPASLGIGLEGMKRRARELGGELHVRNAHPGTLVEVVIPTEGTAVAC